MRRYPYRRGAAVLVFASCNKERGRWVAEKGHQSNLPRVRATAALLHLDIVAELASAATSGPTAAEISAHFAELASRDFSEYDALVVIIASHGCNDAIYGWPDPAANAQKLSGPVPLHDLISQFQPPPPGHEWTRAAQTLLGKPKCFVIDACRVLGEGEHRFTVSLTSDKRNVFEGLPPAAKYDVLRAAHHGGAITTRVSDVLVAYSTVRFNEGGITNLGSNYLNALIETVQRDPSASLQDVLSAVNGAMQMAHAAGRRPETTASINVMCPAPHDAAPSSGYPQCSTFTSELRWPLIFRTPHSPDLRNAEARAPIVGRAQELALLRSALCDRHAAPKLHVVVGSAGLGKTTLTRHAVSSLIESDEGRSYRAVLFVDLHAHFSLDEVKAAIHAQLGAAGIAVPSPQRERWFGPLAGALLVLDNADDPYKHATNRWGENSAWFERLILHTIMKEAHCHVVLTVRDRASVLFLQDPSFCRATTGWELESVLIEHAIGPLHAQPAAELLRAEVSLAQAEVATVLRACGHSPLALKVAGGMLKQLVSFGLDSARAQAVANLRAMLPHAETAVQEVMRQTFGYLEAELVAPFKRLHIFPGHFTVRDCAAVCGMDADAATKTLQRLVAYNLLVEQQSRYMMLDHIWTFAAKEAEASHNSERCETVQLFLRHCMALLTGGALDSLDPIFKAADFHARAWSRRAAQEGDAGEDVAMDDSREIDGREAVLMEDGGEERFAVHVQRLSSAGSSSGDGGDDDDDFGVPVYRSLASDIYESRQAQGANFRALGAGPSGDVPEVPVLRLSARKVLQVSAQATADVARRYLALREAGQ